jgi:hypothetical protein
MAAAFGVPAELFRVKRRGTPVHNAANALSETQTPDCFKVLVYEGDEAGATSQLDAIARQHLEGSLTGTDEAVIVFVPAPTRTAGLMVHRVTALEHSPIVDGVRRHWPSVPLELLPNPGSLREALRGVAVLQPNYVSSSRAPDMVERRRLLELAKEELTGRLNARPTTARMSVDANADRGNAITTPYLRIFDPVYSPNGSLGFCTIVIVSVDGSSVFVSIQKPATTGHPDWRPLPKDELISSSDDAFAELSAQGDVGDLVRRRGATRAMDLAGPVGRLRGRVRNYPHSNVACVRLDAAAMPSDFELVHLVQDFVEITNMLNKEKGTPVTQGEGSSTAEHIHWPQDRVDEMLRSLRDESPQIVLAGPPGTGKSYVARHLAAELLGVPGRVDDERIRVVQFHPTYGYEEFVEGLRPVQQVDGPATIGGGVAFAYKDGPIVELAEKIRQDGDPRVLVIDEINRANIARVFGELMFLLEYRDQGIDLMSHRRFALPSELFIIATMNTADKSTRVMDVALRRRFDFFTILPERRILERHYAASDNENDMGDELFDGFDALNARLRMDLDEHRLIGHSFFMASQFGVPELRRRWDRQIKPLLDEYFFDTPISVGDYSLQEFWPSAGA